ncbi:sigma-70 family RNA polymerase sigma factor [Spongisporangium articulatum]|uniref:Sigma-70 family RNA polymerase sigma factor n=1 Tax=Spongisporangium articulatum TaxID=3362603 RepID=A0ABW8AH49_9ACTN
MVDDGGRVFEDWYASSYGRVHRAVSLAIGDADLAEEATAEAFARALVHWRSVRKADRPDAWVYRVALNEVRSRWRRSRTEARWLARQRLGTVPAPTEPSSELWRAVTQLAPRARTAIALRYVADLSEAEIAAAMGITRGTVAATLHKARARLAELLTMEESS